MSRGEAIAVKAVDGCVVAEWNKPIRPSSSGSTLRTTLARRDVHRMTALSGRPSTPSSRSLQARTCFS